MEEAHLTEIEDTLKRHPGPPANDHLIRLLIAEIRRLKTHNDQADQFFITSTQDRLNLAAQIQRLQKAVDQAYDDGESSKEADIVGIILEAEDDVDAMIQIKHSVGWED